MRVVGGPVSVATLYSTAQCVLSVVGSVGVILLFAGIPQLIYSSHLNLANLLTFLLGALLITAMVAGNAVLNVKFRQYAQRQLSSTSQDSEAVTEDKPPSYETVVELDGPPPDYASLGHTTNPVKTPPPRYEDASSVYSIAYCEDNYRTPTSHVTVTDTHSLPVLSPWSPLPRSLLPSLSLALPRVSRHVTPLNVVAVTSQESQYVANTVQNSPPVIQHWSKENNSWVVPSSTVEVVHAEGAVSKSTVEVVPHEGVVSSSTVEVVPQDRILSSSNVDIVHQKEVVNTNEPSSIESTRLFQTLETFNYSPDHTIYAHIN